jgi:pimeloyl-ACP methyl ester carboxylesterase
MRLGRRSCEHRRMLKAELGGVGLEYADRGDGAPVVFVHAALFADRFGPLVAEPALTRFRLVTYHRVGYAGSDHVSGSVGIAEQGEHCRLLMEHLGIARAHLVGHSSGAAIAMQLALAHPESVVSLALLEPAFPAVPRAAFAAEAVQHYRDGDRASAIEAWMVGVAGSGYSQTLERALPGAHAKAVEDAATFFEQELPAVAAWHFGPEEARRVSVPVLVMLGGRSHEVGPAFDQRHALLLDWLSTAEPYILAGATHLMHVQNSVDAAVRLAAFFDAHS